MMKHTTKMKEYISLIRNEINDNFAENSHAKSEFENPQCTNSQWLILKLKPKIAPERKYI